MEDWKLRVLSERSELQEKINKLRQFVGDKAASNEHNVEFGLLKAQLGAMIGYEAILTMRVQSWNV